MAEVVTTVRLPSGLYEELRRRAFAERRAMAELVREAIARFLRAPKSRDLPPLEDDPLWRAVGLGSGGARDEALEHDHYLYGTPKRRRPRRR